MNDKLKNLRRSMTTTIFKDFDVNEQELKENILKRSKRKRFSFQHYRLQHWMGVSLSVAGIVLLSLFIGSAFFSDQFVESTSKIETSTNPTPNGSEIGTGYPSTEEEKHEDKLVESDDYPEKFKIVNKMFNSLDYIDNAQGVFKWGHADKDDFNHQEFYFDLDKKKSLSKVKLIKDGTVIETAMKLRDDIVSVHKLKEKNMYTVKNDEAHYNEYIAGSGFVTNSEWFTLIYNNYENWTYEEDTAFGMPVYQIKGEIPEEKSESLAGKFTMTVSKETGALLDLKCYGYENKVIFYITVHDIQINQGIQNEDEIFKLEVDGSKQVSWDEYISNTVGSKGVKKGKDDGWER